MTRFEQKFATLKAAGRKALVPFITAGDPSLESTVPVMHALVDAGADVIELGVPFSDPMADGPTIQRASERALAQGMSLRKVLETVRAFRATNPDTPVLMPMAESDLILVLTPVDEGKTGHLMLGQAIGQFVPLGEQGARTDQGNRSPVEERD